MMSHFEMGSTGLYQQTPGPDAPEEDYCWLNLSQAEEVFFDVMNEEMRQILTIFDQEQRTYLQVRTLILLENLQGEEFERIRDFFPNLTSVEISRIEDEAIEGGHLAGRP